MEEKNNQIIADSNQKISQFIEFEIIDEEEAERLADFQSNEEFSAIYRDLMDDIQWREDLLIRMKCLEYGGESLVEETYHELKKQLVDLEAKLEKAGYSCEPLPESVAKKVLYMKEKMSDSIYSQALLERINVSLHDVEKIINDEEVSGILPSEVYKVICLKEAWEFILSDPIIKMHSDLYLLTVIAQIVNGKFDGGNLRGIPACIGGSSYIPPIPNPFEVEMDLVEIVKQDKKAIDIAIELCMYCIRSQLFVDGNKRAAVIFANHFLLGKGEGILVVPPEEVDNLRKILITFYESGEMDEISRFIKERCWKRI